MNNTQQKVDSIIGKAEFSEFMRFPFLLSYIPAKYKYKDIDCFASMMQVMLVLTTKNGKKIITQLISPITISMDDWDRCSKDGNLDNIKNIKKKCAVKSMIYELRRLLTERTGLKAHRGYFTLTDIEVYHSEKHNYIIREARA